MTIKSRLVGMWCQNSLTGLPHKQVLAIRGTATGREQGPLCMDCNGRSSPRRWPRQQQSPGHSSDL